MRAERLFVVGRWVEPDGGHYRVTDAATEEIPAVGRRLRGVLRSGTDAWAVSTR